MIKLNGEVVTVSNFPNGEVLIEGMELKRNILLNEINTLHLNFQNNSDFINLMFVKNYLDSLNVTVNLLIPYLPYSRMDRLEEDRLFTLKYISKFINDLNFNKVIVYEAHSDVSLALLDRVYNVNESIKLADEVYNKEYSEAGTNESIFIVYPDAGAVKRYSKKLGVKNIIECQKDRDFKTGYINSVKLLKNKEYDCKVAIIVDDLCSKGGTFLLTAKALKEELKVEKVILVVTHCENTIFDGELLTTDWVDEIYTTDSILDDTHKKLKIKKI